ncbi:AraC family transcriptional regulator [Ferruginibacter sp.]|uniref:AraC family transcriptional regulator n=1 Tax=Ferruginibacter sp. TaxID=1940288 RepID=UPI002659508F|nr:AraC family transcriptional regulator [Ferruginibacter sp.]
MKPAFENINAINDSSFLIRKFEEKSFKAPFHFHPEYELTLILNGSGKRYVGTHMSDYFSDDLVLLGSNLPHCWKTEKAAQHSISGSVVLHFGHAFLGVDFFKKAEMKSIQDLLNNSNYGIQFTGNISIIKNKMVAVLTEKSAFKKLLLLLEILNELSNTKKYKLLNKQNLFAALPTVEKERMNLVTAYIVENFREKTSLDKAAEAANMTPQSFCKYFKKISRKTFIEVVNDYRIDFAMQELVHTDKTITQIGFESGFNDISNFYKTFKKRRQLSPLTYRNMFVKNL